MQLRLWTTMSELNHLRWISDIDGFLSYSRPLRVANPGD